MSEETPEPTLGHNTISEVDTSLSGGGPDHYEPIRDAEGNLTDEPIRDAEGNLTDEQIGNPEPENDTGDGNDGDAEE